MTHKQRMVMAIQGEMPDIIPYAPRLDLWYGANLEKGTLPEKHRNRGMDEISRAEGWALHKVNPEYSNVRTPEDNLHWALGVLSLKETVFRYRFSSHIDIRVDRKEGRTRVTYHTPVGSVSTSTLQTVEMKKAGISNLWIEEPVIKAAADYRVVGYLFENIEMIPDFDDFLSWQNRIAEDGLAFTLGGRAASPMHHIQKYFLDATAFYYHYHDFQKEMRDLEKCVGNVFDQTLEIIADSPAEGVYWGANFDDMITYPSFFEKEISPWIRKASDILGAKGKHVLCHCDGENMGLMDLIRDSGMHVAEAVCPHPMTKVRVEDYYRRWSDRLTIFGGIPSILLLEESTTDEAFEDYLTHLFKAIAPGTRMIFGIADSTPPNAVFDRLVRIGDRVKTEARLPLEAGALRPVSGDDMRAAAARVLPKPDGNEIINAIQEDVFKGSHLDIATHVREALDGGALARDILQFGMLSAMEVIGDRFTSGAIFIPDVLLSARSMNAALEILEPFLANEKKDATGKVLIGTVRGDLHDIGKNLVTTMLTGVGFEVRDMGINVPTDEIVRQAAEFQPDILGLSALLTTTMPEMKKVIDALEIRGLKRDVKVIVGGAPVNEKFARDIGSDGYARDAGEAVTLAKKLMEPSQSN